MYKMNPLVLYSVNVNFPDFTQFCTTLPVVEDSFSQSCLELAVIVLLSFL